MGKITINELSNSLIEQINDKQDKLDNELETSDKTIVGAINELFQETHDGRQLIANAIGEPLTPEDTFSAMSNGINGLLATFKTNMINNGVTVESNDRFKQLIDKIKGLTEGEGNKGVQYATGTINNNSPLETFSRGTDSVLKNCRRLEVSNLSFRPNIVLIVNDGLGVENSFTNDFTNKITVNYADNSSSTSVNWYTADINVDYTGTAITGVVTPKIKDDGFLLYTQITSYADFTWYAFGVGEGSTQNNGIQFASGEYIATSDMRNDVVVNINLEFEPQYFVVYIKGFTAGIYTSQISYSLDSNNYDLLSSDKLEHSVGLRYYDGYDIRYTSATVKLSYDSEKFTIKGFSNAMYLGANASIKWYAIGVGEENTISGGLDIISATELPATVKNNQIVLITENNPVEIKMVPSDLCKPSINSEINIGYSASANNHLYELPGPASLIVYLNEAKQMVSSQTSYIDGYLGRNNKWEQFSFSREFLYDNGVDNAGISKASNWNNVGGWIKVENKNNTMVITISGAPAGAEYSGNKYYFCYKAIDLTNYNTLNIYYSFTKGTSTLNFVIGSGYSDTLGAGNDFELELKNSVTNAVKTFDISGATGLHYIGAEGWANYSGGLDAVMTITRIELVNK